MRYVYLEYMEGEESEANTRSYKAPYGERCSRVFASAF